MSVTKYPRIESLLSQDIEEAGLFEHKKYLTDLAEPCLSVSDIAEEDYMEIGNSRLAGHPDLPRHWLYPCLDDEFYYTFVAQINLSELPPHHFSLPERGWLYFFLGDQTVSVAEGIKYKVVFYDGDVKELVHTEPPEEMSDTDGFAEEFVAHKMRFELNYSLPFIQPVADLNQDLTNSAFFDLFRCRYAQLFGFADMYNDPLMHVYLQKNGLGELADGYWRTPRDYEDYLYDKLQHGTKQFAHFFEPKIPEYLELHRDYHAHIELHRQRANQWQLLFKVNSIREIGFEWQDGGDLEFFIHRDDLGRFVFDDLYAGIQSG